jgi:hypothetical protein
LPLLVVTSTGYVAPSSWLGFSGTHGCTSFTTPAGHDQESRSSARFVRRRKQGRGSCWDRGLTFFRVGESHDQVRLLDPEDDLAVLVRRRGHRMQLPLSCNTTRRVFSFPHACNCGMGTRAAAVLTVRHRDEHLIALGQRRTGPRVVEVEFEVVLRPRRARTVRPLVLAVAAVPFSQRRGAPQCCGMSSEQGGYFFQNFVTFSWAAPGRDPHPRDRKNGE